MCAIYYCVQLTQGASTCAVYRWVQFTHSISVCAIYATIFVCAVYLCVHFTHWVCAVYFLPTKHMVLYFGCKCAWDVCVCMCVCVCVCKCLYFRTYVLSIVPDFNVWLHFLIIIVSPCMYGQRFWLVIWGKLEEHFSFLKRRSCKLREFELIMQFVSVIFLFPCDEFKKLSYNL